MQGQNFDWLKNKMKKETGSKMNKFKGYINHHRQHLISLRMILTKKLLNHF